MPDTSEDRNVEDVLSSVRRLVSGEISGAQRKRTTSQALVLTPRQRISEARGRIAAQSLEDRIAELEAQLADRQDEWEPDGSEDPSTHQPSEPIILTSTSVRAATADELSEAEEDDPAPPRTMRRLSRIELVDAEKAEEPDTQGAADETPEPEPAPDFDRDLAKTVAQSVNAVISEIAERGDLIDEASERHRSASDIADVQTDMENSLETAARLNEAMDAAVDEAQPSRATRAQPASAPTPGDRLEDDLRDLVAQIIREELQGELGARITRNVRKLVRREIQRALAARDLS